MVGTILAIQSLDYQSCRHFIELFASGDKAGSRLSDLRQDPSVIRSQIVQISTARFLGVVDSRMCSTCKALCSLKVTALYASFGNEGFLDWTVLSADSCEVRELVSTLRGARETEVELRNLGPLVGSFEMTPRQREALLGARRLGLFKVPRRGTLDDLALLLGVSKNSASATLRRAVRILVESHL